MTVPDGKLIATTTYNRDKQTVVVTRAEPSRGAPDAPVCECGKPRRHAGRCKGRRNGGINGTSVIVVPGLFAELEKLRASHVVLLEALRRLTAKLKLIQNDDRYMRVWTMAMLHGETYDGPNYEAELAEAEAAIQQAERT